MKNSYNYNTYYKGTPKDLEDCNIIYLICSENYNVNPDKLWELEKEMMEKKDYIVCTDKTDYFNIKIDKLFKFDVILYCSKLISIDSIIGLTILSSPQKLYTEKNENYIISNVKLKINFSVKESEVKDLEISNSMVSTSVNLYLPGDKLDDYMLPVVKPSEAKFTDNINIFNSGYNILTDSIFSHIGSSNFYVIPEILADIQTYNIFRIGFYKEDLVVFACNTVTGQFSIRSITKYNSFNKPYEYRSEILPKEFQGKEFYSYANSIIVFKDSEFYYTYYTEKGYEIKPIQENSRKIYAELNPWSMSGINYIYDSDLIKNVKSICIYPEDFGSKYEFLEKIGSWWKFKHKSGVFYYLSHIGCFYTKEDAILLSDRIVLIPGNSVKVCLIEFGKIINLDEESFTIRRIRISDLGENIKRFINGIRKRPYKTAYFPNENLITFMGILFYRVNNKLYCF